MSNKIALLVFTTAVLLASSLVYIPLAAALTQSTVDDNHTVARWGNSKVCGDHLCVPGEHDKWMKALNDAQRGFQAGHARNAQHGESVIQQLAQTTSNTMIGNMTANMATTTNNMTNSGNMTITGNMTMPNGYR